MSSRSKNLRYMFYELQDLIREVDDFDRKCEASNSGDEMAFADFDSSDVFVEGNRIANLVKDFKESINHKLKELE